MAEKIKENNDVEFFDQGLASHVFTFKTNTLFLDRKLITIDEMARQTFDMVSSEDNDHVCFNA